MYRSAADGDVVAAIDADEADRLVDDGTFRRIVPAPAAVGAARLGMRAEIGETAVIAVSVAAGVMFSRRTRRT
jgi:hypothetical protein